MRLTCPNCEAQYEVPDDAIPAEGRDVQCSSCGHTWFQLHPEQEAAIAASREAIGAENGWDIAPETPASAPEPAMPRRPVAVEDDYETEDEALTDDAPETSGSGNLVPDFEAAAPEEPEAEIVEDLAMEEPDEAEAPFEQDAEEEDAPVPPPVQAKPRQMDKRVMDVLRAEATHEAQVRAAEQSALESQPDLGIESSIERNSVLSAQDSEEPAAKPEPAEPVAVAAATTARKDALPDIDQINSTLRSASDRREMERSTESGDAEGSAKRGGFGRGFIWAVALIVLLIVLYLIAPPLAESVPALAGPLGSYTDAVGSLWVWLDGMFAGVLGMMDGLSSETPSE